MNEKNNTTPRQDPATWTKSRWSAVGWAVHCKTTLPCWPDRCRYIDRRHCEDPAGDGCPCAYELEYADYHRRGYAQQFSRARYELGDETFRELIDDLVMAQVRLLRIKVRENHTSLHVRRLMDDPATLTHEVELAHRYYVTARHHWCALIDRLREAARDPYEGMDFFERTDAIKRKIERALREQEVAEAMGCGPDDGCLHPRD